MIPSASAVLTIAARLELKMIASITIRLPTSANDQPAALRALDRPPHSHGDQDRQRGFPVHGRGVGVLKRAASAHLAAHQRRLRLEDE